MDLVAKHIEVVELAFENFLTHSCTLHLPGKVLVGKDNWNRPIYEEKQPVENVSCRFITKKKNVVSLDGNESIYETSLLLLPEEEIDSQMKVSEIRDQENRILSEKRFEVIEILPRYKQADLLNYKVVLKGAE